MTTALRSSLLSAAATTFESLALLLPSAALTAEEAAAPLAVGVQVGFDGPLRGRIELRVTDDVARAITENMLGVAATDEAIVRDALGEVANVVCGNALPSIGGGDAVFRLDAPHAASLTPAVGTPNAALALGIDGGRAELALYLD